MIKTAQDIKTYKKQLKEALDASRQEAAERAQAETVQSVLLANPVGAALSVIEAPGFQQLYR